MKNNQKKVSRRDAIGKMALYSGAAVAGSTFGALTSCNFGGKSTPTLTSGYLPIVDSVPIIVAYEKGFFKELGIKASKPALIRTWPALIEAFASKQILLTHIILPQVIFLRYAQQIPLRSIAFNHTDVIGMVTSPELEKPSDLGGKMAAVPLWWSAHNGLFQEVLRKMGLKPVIGKSKEELAPDEVGLIIIPPPDMAEALKTGVVSGYVISEPFAAAGEIMAGAKHFKMSGDIWPHNPCCQSVLLQSTIDKDRSYAQAVTNAIYKAAHWCHFNKEELAEIVGKDGGGYFPMPVEVMKRAIAKNDLKTYGPTGTGAIMHTEWQVMRAGFNPFPFPSAFETTIEVMRRTVVDPSVQLPQEIMNLTGRQIAETIVEYDLAKIGYDSIGGKGVFGLDTTQPYEREEKYEILLKEDLQDGFEK